MIVLAAFFPMSKTPQVTAGRIVVKQDGESIILEHRGKTGETITLRIDPKVLERWAVRQIRQEVFA